MPARTYEEFMAEIANSDPERYKTVAAKYAVLSEHQMRLKSRREIAISQMSSREARLAFWDMFYSVGDSFEGGPIE